MSDFTLDEAHEAWPTLESVTLLKARLETAMLADAMDLRVELATARNRIRERKQDRDSAKNAAPPPRGGYAHAFEEAFGSDVFREFEKRAAQGSAFGGYQREQRRAPPPRTADQLKALELARKCRAMETVDNVHQAAVARRKTDDLLAKAGLTRGDL